MAIMRASEETGQAMAGKSRQAYRSGDELVMRAVVEGWGRERWPGARAVHELVVGRGEARADLAFVQAEHFAAIELKSAHDTTARMIHQIGMFRLVSPELWLVVDDHHRADAELAGYLLPSMGVAVITLPNNRHTLLRDRCTEAIVAEARLEVIREPGPWVPHAASMLALLWVAELRAEAMRRQVWSGHAGTHAKLVDAMLKTAPAEQLASVCRQLRRRDAFWRADPPITG